MTRRTWLISICLLLTSFALMPSAQANPCDGPYCCDRDPLSIVMTYVDRGVQIVYDLLGRTTEVVGKARCDAYQIAGLCAEESFPPPISLTRTNPSGAHGHASPCYELFAPGFESQGGCPVAHALRHIFDGASDAHACVPIQNVFLPL